MKRDWQGSDGRREWLMRRNCALTPRQTMAVWAVLLALSLTIGLAFAWQGAWYVLVFSTIEMAAVTAGFLVYSRHATDFDRIVFENGVLLVEKVRGGRASTIQLDPCWLRVHTPQRRRDPIRLVARGISVDVGTWLPEEPRRALARELRQQLAQ